MVYAIVGLSLAIGAYRLFGFFRGLGGWQVRLAAVAWGIGILVLGAALRYCGQNTSSARTSTPVSVRAFAIVSSH